MNLLRSPWAADDVDRNSVRRALAHHRVHRYQPAVARPIKLHAERTNQ